jgi:hypothetical protein
MAEKRMPAAERQRETTVSVPSPLRGGAVDNRPDTGSCRARKGADASQVSLRGLDASAADRTEGQVRHPRW